MSRNDDTQGTLRVSPITLAGKSILPAKGYSPTELERAGVTEEDAQRLDLAVDRDRKTMVGANVMQLRRLISA